MSSLFTVPSWMPWWLPIVILVPLVLYALVFLLMPFSVFGVKGRLEGIEARLDEIQGEIRELALRLPEPVEDDEREFESPSRRPQIVRPPVPPARTLYRHPIPREGDGRPVGRFAGQDDQRRESGPVYAIRDRNPDRDRDRPQEPSRDDRRPARAGQRERAEPRVDWPRS